MYIKLDASITLLEACKSLDFKAHEAVILLHKYYADPNYQNPGTYANALHWCARRGNLGVMKILVKSGANLQAVDSRNRNTLIWACDTKRF
jgi:ankyrin repeat protein